MTQDEIKAKILDLVEQYNKNEAKTPLLKNKYGEIAAHRLGLALLSRYACVEEGDEGDEEDPFGWDYDGSPVRDVLTPGATEDCWYSSFC